MLLLLVYLGVLLLQELLTTIESVQLGRLQLVAVVVVPQSYDRDALLVLLLGRQPTQNQPRAALLFNLAQIKIADDDNDANTTSYLVVGQLVVLMLLLQQQLKIKICNRNNHASSCYDNLLYHGSYYGSYELAQQSLETTSAIVSVSGSTSTKPKISASNTGKSFTRLVLLPGSRPFCILQELHATLLLLQPVSWFSRATPHP